MAKTGKEKRYIGDAVYVEYDGWGLTLTTEGSSVTSTATNTIYLEPEVYRGLVAYVAEILAERHGG